MPRRNHCSFRDKDIAFHALKWELFCSLSRKTAEDIIKNYKSKREENDKNTQAIQKHLPFQKNVASFHNMNIVWIHTEYLYL